MLETETKSPLADVTPGSYRLDPEHTTITIRVKWNWGLHTVKGSFGLHQGSFVLDESGNLTDVAATIDVASFDSHNGRRDRHIKSADFLDAERFPTITFAGGRSRLEGEHPVLSGAMTIHGVTETVDVQIVKIEQAGGLARFEATARLDRTRFGVTHMPRRVGTAIAIAISAAAAEI
jgi:polyisoprenoid-binding protein YceI